MNGNLKRSFENNRERRQKRRSFIMTRINRFVSFLYSLVMYGFVGRFAASGDDYFRKSRIGRFLHNCGRNDKDSTVAIRMTLNKALFGNGGVRILRATGRFFASLSMNVYGFFFAMYGIASIVVYYLKLFLEWGESLGESALLTSIIVIFCSIPFAASSQSIIEIIVKGKLAHRLFVDYLGISDERLDCTHRMGGSICLLIASILGLFAGTSAYLLHPLYLIGGFAAIVIIVLIIYNPESGIMITIPIVPFLKYLNYEKELLILLITVTLFSYLIKYVKRQRRWQYSPEGIVLCIFNLFLLAVSAFSDVGVQSLLDAVCAVVVISGGYFLTRNLMRNERMIDHALSSLTLSMVVICLIGVWNTGYDAVTDIMIRNVNENVGHIVKQLSLSVADNSEIFGIFAAAVMPVIFSGCFNLKKKRIRGIVSSILCFIFVFLCSLFFGSYESALVMIIGIIMYIIMHSHKTLTSIGVIAIPVISVIIVYPMLVQRYGIPDFTDYIRSIFPHYDLTSAYSEVVAENVWNMIFDNTLFGIGVGKEAFVHAFRPYSNAVSFAVNNAGSLWLQLICWVGIPGTFVFISFLVLQYRSAVGYMIRSTNYNLRHKVSAMFCSISCLLILGNAGFIWSDIRMMYIFWLCAGLLSAYVRIGNAEENRNLSFCQSDDSVADASIKMGF